MQENKKKTEQELFLLTEENKILNRENDYFKREEVKLQEMVQSQKDEMTVLLQNELRQLKAQLQGQNAVVDVLSKQVVSVSSYLLRFSLCRWSPHYTCNNLDQIIWAS